ncbi:MAG: ATP-dependent protease ATPase subunit HslU [Clostridia bacterium]|nr:ATP-dependent protease ATPase subunit HslU [Clostridia bacterium]
MLEYTPKQIVAELDRFIIGQDEAKKAVAVALRNRYRRSRLSKELRDEITPKNIIMKGPTGVGKTEIARRLAKLVKAPFVKVEATKYTEVGYVGRDVESMVRDLVEASYRLVKEEQAQSVEEKAKEKAENQLVPAIMEKRKDSFPDLSEGQIKAYILQELREGKIDDLVIDIMLPDVQKPQMIGQGGSISFNLADLTKQVMGGGRPPMKKRSITVANAYKQLFDEAVDSMIDKDDLDAMAIERAENDGIIFIDEIDKIAQRGNTQGNDVSREGVQRDILPIVEGCTVNTKHGNVKTDYILFIAAGAFHIASVSDLIPELQGRFPVKVELQSLTKKDFVEILTKPDNAILMQYTELLKVDNVRLKFTKEAIEEIAEVAYAQNESDEDIGARRLQTIMEKLLEDVSYELGASENGEDVTVDKKYVDDRLGAQLQSLNLNKFIL